MPTGLAFWYVLQLAACAIIGFAGGCWVLSNWFDRKLVGWEAGLLLLGLLTAMFFAIASVFAGGPGVLILAGVVFGGALAIRGIAVISDRRLGSQLDNAEIAKYQRAIEDHPENPYAHSLLADTYRRLGKLEEALSEYELAIRMDPSLKEEHHWLEWVRTELERRASKVMSCPVCRAERRPGAVVCEECHRPYSSIETWLHRYRVMDAHQRAFWTGIGLVCVVMALALRAFAPALTGALGGLALLAAPMALFMITARIRRNTR